MCLDIEFNRQNERAASTFDRLTSWRTECLLRTPILQSIKHELPACCSTVARLGVSTSDRSDASALFIFSWEALSASTAPTGGHRYPYFSSVCPVTHLRNLCIFLQQRRLRWLGRGRRMRDRKIPKLFLLATVKRAHRHRNVGTMETRGLERREWKRRLFAGEKRARQK